QPIARLAIVAIDVSEHRERDQCRGDTARPRAAERCDAECRQDIERNEGREHVAGDVHRYEQVGNRELRQRWQPHKDERERDLLAAPPPSREHPPQCERRTQHEHPRTTGALEGLEWVYRSRRLDPGPRSARYS